MIRLGGVRVKAKARAAAVRRPAAMRWAAALVVAFAVAAAPVQLLPAQAQQTPTPAVANIPVGQTPRVSALTPDGATLVVPNLDSSSVSLIERMHEVFESDWARVTRRGAS